MTDDPYRIVIAVDIYKPTLLNAYMALYKAMAKVELDACGDIQWESTDEAYYPEGGAVDPETLSSIRMQTVAMNNPEKETPPNKQFECVLYETKRYTTTVEAADGNMARSAADLLDSDELDEDGEYYELKVESVREV